LPKAKAALLADEKSRFLLSDQEGGRRVYAFDAGDVVRLKRDDPPHFRAGDAGVVWGIYALSPPVYEATFCNQAGYEADRMFDEEEVEKVPDIAQVYLTENLREFRKEFRNGKPAKDA
jgi:hypothetical protein